MRVDGDVGDRVGGLEGAIKSKTLVNPMDSVEVFEASHTAAEGSATRLELASSPLAWAPN